MIKSYFTKYKKVPTMDAIKVALSEIDNDILKVGVVENLKNATKYVNADDLEFVKEKCIDFCRNQNLKNAILQSVDLLGAKNYDGIKKLVDDAMKAGGHRSAAEDRSGSMCAARRRAPALPAARPADARWCRVYRGKNCRAAAPRRRPPR